MRIYFSGSHGSGKSTLMHALAERFPARMTLYPEDRFTFPKVENNYFERLKSKLLRYYFEELDQQEFEKKTREKILLCSRCVYDSVAYSRAYLKLGWIKQKEYLKLENITATVFENFPERIVIVNPSLEILQRQLWKRWESSEKKWNEKNLVYLQATQQEFSVLADKLGKKVLSIPEENLEEKVRKIVEWVKRL